MFYFKGQGPTYHIISALIFIPNNKAVGIYILAQKLSQYLKFKFMQILSSL